MFARLEVLSRAARKEGFLLESYPATRTSTSASLGVVRGIARDVLAVDLQQKRRLLRSWMTVVVVVVAVVTGVGWEG